MFGFAFVAVIRGFVLEEPAFQEAPSVVHASSGVPAVGWSREQLGPAPAGRDMDRAISPPALQTGRLTGQDVAAEATFDVKRPPRRPGVRPIPRERSGASPGLCGLAPERRARSSPVPGPIGSPRLRLWDERDRSAADTIAASGDPPVPGARCWLQRRRRRRGKRACA
jgi:hypothetical protein